MPASSTAKAHPFAHLDPLRQQIAMEKAWERVRAAREKALQGLQDLQREMARRVSQQKLEDIPPAYRIFEEEARYKGAHGGRGSAKSWTFAKLLIKRCVAKPGTRWACIREIQKSLEQSVKRLLEDMIEACGVGDKFRVLTTHIETPGGGIIIFQGMQNHTADSIKSLEGYDGCWVEEAQTLSERSLTLLRPTFRKDGSELWFTWNPEHETDPVDALLRSANQPPECIVREVNYKQNPHFPAVLQKEMEYDLSRDVEKYNHVWLGQYQRNSEARVFKNWRVEEFETPYGVSFLYGGDWGFATDPDVLIRCYISGSDLFVDQEQYGIGVEIDDTPAFFDRLACTKQHVHDCEKDRRFRPVDKLGIPIPECDAVARAWQITTDSARPETISYMQRHGYPRVVGAIKGPGSIEDGITFLRNYNIIVHPRCTHTKDELISYCYKKDPLTGLIIPVLEDKKNHVIDSLRYAVENVRTAGISFVTW